MGNNAEILDELTTSRGEVKVRTFSFSEERHSQVTPIQALLDLELNALVLSLTRVYSICLNAEALQVYPDEMVSEMDQHAQVDRERR